MGRELCSRCNGMGYSAYCAGLCSKCYGTGYMWVPDVTHSSIIETVKSESSSLREEVHALRREIDEIKKKTCKTKRV